MSKQEHSPLPWIGGPSEFDRGYSIVDSGGLIVAWFPSVYRENRAAVIGRMEEFLDASIDESLSNRNTVLQAMDARADLVAELQDAQQIMRDAAATIANTKPAMSAELHHAADSANAAIAKAAE